MYNLIDNKHNSNRNTNNVKQQENNKRFKNSLYLFNHVSFADPMTQIQFYTPISSYTSLNEMENCSTNPNIHGKRSKFVLISAIFILSINLGLITSFDLFFELTALLYATIFICLFNIVFSILTIIFNSKIFKKELITVNNIIAFMHLLGSLLTFIINFIINGIIVSLIVFKSHYSIIESLKSIKFIIEIVTILSSLLSSMISLSIFIRLRFFKS
jgi:hypothetical protein